MRFDVSSTIVARASPEGKGAIGVVRLSGSESWEIVLRSFRTRNGKPVDFIPWQARYGLFLNGDSVIDEVIVLPFKAPHSYTGEDMVEIYCHGNDIIIKKIVEKLIKEGARHAEPGEFTLRAVINGRMDMRSSVVIDSLIKAESDYIVEKAIKELTGASSENVLCELADSIAEILAHVESIVEFPEEDIPELSLTSLDLISQKINSIVEKARKGVMLQKGIKVVISGEPNVGKSTLFNRLLSMERVVVSSTPGTTGDVIGEDIEIEGVKIKLFDTPGIQEYKEPLMKKSMDMAEKFLRDAHIVMFVVDAEKGFTRKSAEILSSIRNKRVIKIINKIDKKNVNIKNFEDAIKISALKGVNIDRVFLTLRREIKNIFEEEFMVVPESVLFLLEDIKKGIERVKELIPFYDMVAQELKASLRYAQVLCGRNNDPDILGMIFSKFCIGK